MIFESPAKSEQAKAKLSARSEVSFIFKMEDDREESDAAFGCGLRCDGAARARSSVHCSHAFKRKKRGAPLVGTVRVTV